MGNPVICDPANNKNEGQSLFEKINKKMNDAPCHTQSHNWFDIVCLRSNMRHAIPSSEANKFFQGDRAIFT